jgi:class 3 adenylate cyclase
MADVSVEVFAFFGLGTPLVADDSVAQSKALRTILFTDLVSHTEMMSRLGDERGRAVLREHEAITRNILKQHAGTEVKTMGDGFMASFASVTRAVECAVALQLAFEARNNATTPDPTSGVRFQPDGGGAGATTPDPGTPGVRFQPDRGGAGDTTLVEPLNVRVGLNAGEPIEEEAPDGRRDLFGATVILASRIAARAEGGEILVADTVRGLCSGKGFLFADRGEFVAKGFEEPVRVYEVSWRG